MDASARSRVVPDSSRPLLPREIGKLRPGEIYVNELFTSIQGESTFAGIPCFFVRLAGCHLRCTYCDTEYAFHEGRRETVKSCIRKAKQSGCSLVEITGGEPLLQRATLPLLAGLCDTGFQVLLETSGSLELQMVDSRVHKIVDVKCPSSNMEDRNLADLAQQVKTGDELKFVMASREDYEWAKTWIQQNLTHLPKKIPIHFSPVHGVLFPRDLAAWIVEDHLPVRLNLQIHKYIWPDTERGT